MQEGKGRGSGGSEGVHQKSLGGGGGRGIMTWVSISRANMELVCCAERNITEVGGQQDSQSKKQLCVGAGWCVICMLIIVLWWCATISALPSPWCRAMLIKGNWCLLSTKKKLLSTGSLKLYSLSPMARRREAAGFDAFVVERKVEKFCTDLMAEESGTLVWYLHARCFCT